MTTDINIDFSYTDPRMYWSMHKDQVTGAVCVYPGDEILADSPRVLPPLSGESWSHEDAIKYELGSRIIDWFKAVKGY